VHCFGCDRSTTRQFTQPGAGTTQGHAPCAADLARLLADRKAVSEDLAAAGVDLAIAQRNLSAAHGSLAKAQQDHATALGCLSKRLKVESAEQVCSVLFSVLPCFRLPTRRRLRVANQRACLPCCLMKCNRQQAIDDQPLAFHAVSTPLQEAGVIPKKSKAKANRKAAQPSAHAVSTILQEVGVIPKKSKAKAKRKAAARRKKAKASTWT